MLATCPAVAVDPTNQLKFPLRTTDRFFEQTSDEFFASHSCEEVLGASPDLVFIDGMHLSEFALRDFINVESWASPSTVVVFDDVVPAKIEFAGRDPEGFVWAGDVYKTLRVLKHLRPDLRIDAFRVPYTGLAVVRDLDPGNTTLRDQYAVLEEELQGSTWEASVAELHEEFATRDRSHIREALRA